MLICFWQEGYLKDEPVGRKSLLGRLALILTPHLFGKNNQLDY